MRVCGRDIWDHAGPPRSAPLLCRATSWVQFFDTADSTSLHRRGNDPEALHPYPRDLVIGTKGGLLRPNRHAWDPDGRPEHLRRALDGSLKRLKLDRIDLYQLHAPDPQVRFEDSVGVLAELQRSGKIRHIGISNVDVKQLEIARRVATIVSVQNEYNIDNRSSEDVLKACELLGIAFLPWYPLGAGVALRSTKVKELAKKLKASPAQIAIAWLLAKSPVMLPIPGTSSIQHLEENVARSPITLP